MKSLCCGYEFDMRFVSKDNLGFCSTCPKCHGSFDVNMKQLSRPEFMTLKKDDEIFIRVHDTLIKSVVYNKPAYNADCTSPDWEVETSNGSCDAYSCYVVEEKEKPATLTMDSSDFILSYCYELYKQDWVNTHTTAESRLQAIRDYMLYIQEEIKEYGDDCGIMTFEEYIYEQGYRGCGLYVSYAEFEENEFRNREYMKTLLKDVTLIAEYLLAISILDN